MQAGRLSIWRSAVENPQPLARALCIVVAVALIGFELWSAIAAHFDRSNATRPHTATAAHNAVNVEQITAADLFGHAANQNSNLPQTDLQVTLRAVFSTSDPKTASAVIETSDGNTQMVKIGGAVGGSATLQTVYSNRIVLSRNGALETLYFPEPQESTAVNNVAQNTQLPTTSDAANTNPPSGASAEEIKRAAILQRLEELRAQTPR